MLKQLGMFSFLDVDERQWNSDSFGYLFVFSATPRNNGYLLNDFFAFLNLESFITRLPLFPLLVQSLLLHS